MISLLIIFYRNLKYNFLLTEKFLEKRFSEGKINDDIGSAEEVRKMLFYGILGILMAKDNNRYDRNKIQNFLHFQLQGSQ